MPRRFAASIIAFCLALPAFSGAQEPIAEPGEEEPEEVIVFGRRNLQRLRVELWNAEKAAYDVFNTFNDEERFDIKCEFHAPTGGRIRRQVCTPNFELEATRLHGQDYYWSLYALLDEYTDDASAIQQHIPVEMMIATQQKDYRNKMKQVAEEHPEFLDALKRYAELRNQYDKATQTAGE